MLLDSPEALVNLVYKDNKVFDFCASECILIFLTSHSPNCFGHMLLFISLVYSNRLSNKHAVGDAMETRYRICQLKRCVLSERRQYSMARVMCDSPMTSCNFEFGSVENFQKIMKEEL